MSSYHHLLLGSLRPSTNDFLIPILSERNYVVSFAEGHEALLQAVHGTLDLLLLDLHSSDELDFLSEIRALLVQPIIAIGPLRNDRLLIAVLERGADDFVPRPFHTNELLARVRAHLRRQNSNWSRSFQVGQLHLEAQSREAVFRAQPLDLSPNEYNLLAVLAAQPGQSCSASYLLNQIWGPRFSQDFALLQLTIHNLRQQLGDDPAVPKLVCGDLKQGYWLESKELGNGR
ncbi:MAG: response regulator transcription factor [Chloroflexales bacterium]|nr:response regulator transcription factor [Chloroflexales bacterium]